jgi:hypothetical protein
MKAKTPSVLLGTVVRIDCKAPTAFAKVKLRKRGRRAKVFWLKVRHLLAAGVAYSGARFFHTTTDVGADRTIVITPDEKANERGKKRLSKLLKEYKS